MKRVVKTMYVVLCCTLLAFSACKKNDQPNAEATVQKEVTLYRSAAAGPAGRTASGSTSLIRVNISSQLMTELRAGKNLILQPTATGQYTAQSALRGLPTTGNDDGLVFNPNPGPCNWTFINAQFNAYMAANMAAFQAAANMTCSPYMGAWSDPVPCVCYLFIVYPNSIPCTSGNYNPA
jgi:hypothetical protein